MAGDGAVFVLDGNDHDFAPVRMFGKPFAVAKNAIHFIDFDVGRCGQRPSFAYESKPFELLRA